MQATELRARETQLKMQCSSSGGSPFLTKPDTNKNMAVCALIEVPNCSSIQVPNDITRQRAREPLSLRQLQEPCTLLTRGNTSIKLAKSLKHSGVPNDTGSWEQAREEDQTLSTTRELLNFIKSLDDQFDTGIQRKSKNRSV